MTAITVLGWDGSPLTAPASAALGSASLVVGGRRALAAVPVPEGVATVALGDLGTGLDALAAHAGEAVVLAGGDPGFFGVVRALRARGLDPAAVHPAVSAVALAFARVGLPWDDAAVVSAHGRDLRPAVNVCLAAPKVAVLTGPGAGPAELGAALIAAPRTLVVATDLGAPTESVVRCAPAEAAARTWPEPTTVLVLDERRPAAARGWLGGWPGGVAPAGWALPEDAFAHRDAQLTKREVRALALARLGPGPGRMVWDVGAGSGSVAVECARFGAASVAVERDGPSCDRISGNAAAHAVDVRVVRGSAPEALAGLPVPDAVFVGGGGPAVVAGVLAAAPERVVVALAAVDRLAPVRDLLAGAGYAVDGVQLSAARFAGLPDGATRLAATNPVLLLWGERR